MKRQNLFGLTAFTAVVFILVAIIPMTGCKDFGVPDFELKVTVGEGVSGVPESGEYTYKELSIVEYQYEANDPELVVEVIVNTSRWATEGSITMYNDTTLEARIFDVRGSWTIKLVSQSADFQFSDQDKEFDIEFTGATLKSGDFVDSRGHTGTWEIQDQVITITFSDWYDYTLTGSAATMSGNWAGQEHEGTWSSSRN